MKKSKLFLAFVGSLFFTGAIAQVEVDLNVGLNNSSVDVTGISESIMPTTSARTTLSIGSDISYKIDKHFSISTGVSYQNMGFVIEEGTAFNLAGIDIPLGVELQVSENEISIPLVLKYSYPISSIDLYAKVGASMGIGVGGTYKTVANTLIDITLNESNIGYSQNSLFNRNAINAEMAIGSKFPYGIGHITTELGFRRGLTDKLESDFLDTDITYNAVQFKLGYSLEF